METKLDIFIAQPKQGTPCWKLSHPCSLHGRRYILIPEVTTQNYYPFQWIKTLRKWKKTPGDNIILHKCTKTHDHMPHCSWDTMHDNCSFLFWAIFCPFTPLTTQKIKIKKFFEKRLEISFYTCVPKILIT